MSERKIGKVISVDSFRIIVQLDEDLKSLYKSGYHDIYEIARINSYLIIPVGADRIVAIVTRVKIQDETEIEKSTGYITLPKAQRYLVATMIGTIENGVDYIQGVYNFPILDNPVWYVVKDDLNKIFDTVKISYDYAKDYYLPVGTSPAFTDFKIRINPDKFFGKHAAILGNTGSGKSCTVASILQSLFAFDYKENKKLQGANIILFDTNGEYKRAFIGEKDEYIYKDNALVNAICIDKDGLNVPFWFMNFDDFDYLFEPSANTQTPILKRAIGLAKNVQTTLNKPILTKFIEKGVMDLLDISPDELKKKKCTQSYGNWNYNSANEILDLSNAINPHGDTTITSIKDLVLQLGGNITKAVEDQTLLSLKEKFNEYLANTTETKLALEKNIDLPIWFDYNKLITQHMDEAINEQDNSKNRIKEFVSTLRLRLQAYLNDERIASPLLLNHTQNIENGLPIFLAYILGDLFKIHVTSNNDIFSSYYNKQIANIEPGNVNDKKPNQVTIIDMSLLPYEVLETITGLIGRLVLELLSRFPNKDRASFPVVMVLEEAQNYIPEKDRGDRVSISKKVFERIAREGRKYGMSLLVSSQRPSELSKTVLSQCNSFIVHRLQNPDDQKYVRQLVSAANEDILQQLPILPQQHAIIMGDAVRTPVQMRVNSANPTPNSENPKFVENWLKDIDKKVPDYLNISNAWSEGKGVDAYLEEIKEKAAVQLVSTAQIEPPKKKEE